jgi:hypothetical protein
MNSSPAVPRRVGRVLLDDGIAWMLAALAAAGSFTHIRDLAVRSGQHGWMANAIAVCIDMMCVMAVRERKRDQRLGRPGGRLKWPTVVLTIGICLTIAANLATAQRTPWGWIVAATPAATFLIAVSMLERRASLPDRSAATDPCPSDQLAADTRPVDVRFARPEDPPDLADLARLRPRDVNRHLNMDRAIEVPADMNGPRRRQRSNEMEVRARAVLAQRPDVTGADLGRELGVTERHGRRLRNRLAPVVG